MATNKIYISAGLQISKTSTTIPTAGKNTVYITAGLPPIINVVSAGSILKISGVTWTNTLKVSGVAKASISKISGVSAV
jgi:hypothetical protein